MTELAKCLAHAALWMTFAFIVVFNLYFAPAPAPELEFKKPEVSHGVRQQQEAVAEMSVVRQAARAGQTRTAK